MNKLIALPLFFFLLLGIPAFATPLITVDYNVSSSTSSSSKFIECINSTADNQIYCYILNSGVAGSYWYTKLERYNSTLGNRTECTIETSSIGNNNNGMLIIDQNTMLYNWGSAYCEYWNISNMNCSKINETSYTQCSQMTNGITNNWAQSNGVIYSIRTGQIINANNLSQSSTGFWPTTYDFGSGNNINLYLASTPSNTDNSSLYVAGIPTSLTSPAYQSSGILAYSDGILTNVIPDFSTTFGIYSVHNETYFDIIQNGAGDYWIYLFNKDLARVYRANWTINSSIACDRVDEPLGTKCTDSQNYVINTNNCNLEYGICPSESVCVQTSPVLNATSDLIENYTSCMINTYLGTQVKCSNVCFAGSVVWSNCYDNGCKKCPDSNGLINYGTQTGYFTNTYYSNSGSVSVGGYTISCVDQLTGKEIYSVNQSGNQTTVIDIIKQSGNEITEINTNTSTPEIPTTTQSICASAGGSLGLAIAGMFGISECSSALAVSALFISFLVSVGILILCAIYIEISGSTAGILFIGGNLFLLVMFTLAGWFPAWLIVVLIVLACMGVGAMFMGLVG